MSSTENIQEKAKVWADCMLSNEHWLRNLRPAQVRALAGRYSIEGWNSRPLDELMTELKRIRDIQTPVQG